MRLTALLFTGEGSNAESREDLKSLLTGYLTRRYPPASGGFTIDESPDGAEFRDPAGLRPYRLVAFPGGFDLGFVSCLGESGMSNLRDHVTSGRGCGYLGICAGAYFACARIEFAKGDSELEVTGSRLGFFAGCGVGPAFPGFDYQSLAGARAAEVAAVRDRELPGPERVRMYFNGGPAFIGDASAKRLAVYTEPAAQGRAAVVLARCGAGAALLFGAHPEMSKAQLQLSDDARLRDIAAQLRADEEMRRRVTYRMLDSLMDLIDDNSMRPSDPDSLL